MRNFDEIKVGGRVKAKVDLIYCKKGTILTVLRLKGNTVFVEPNKDYSGRINIEYLEAIKVKIDPKKYYEKY